MTIEHVHLIYTMYRRAERMGMMAPYYDHSLCRQFDWWLERWLSVPDDLVVEAGLV